MTTDYYEDDEFDDFDDDESETVPCPSCGKEVYEESERCPYCSEYIVHNRGINPLWQRTAWMLIIGAGLLAAIYFSAAIVNN